MAGRTARSPFTRLVSTAVAAGLLAGLALTAVQKVQVTPLIAQAETYEDAKPAAWSMTMGACDMVSFREMLAGRNREREDEKNDGCRLQQTT